MTRPTLFWTVQYQYRTLHVMRVTRVSQNRVFGTVAGRPSHCSPAVVYGEYDTESAAHSATRKITRLMIDGNDRIIALTREIEQLEQSTQQNIINALERLRRCK